MRSMRLIAPLLWTLAALGCANARLVDPGQPVELADDQGILVVHVDSDFAIRRLRFGNGLDAAEGLPAGEYLALVVVPAGSYRWTALEVPIPFANVEFYYRFRLRRDIDWSFEVEPGSISYPGQVLVKGSHAALAESGMLDAWTENRPAMALEQLRELHPALLDRYPLVNGRSVRDDFLERYQKLVPRRARAASEAASR